ncbi:hypothetical protein [Deinococcus ruber]|uniref:Uncharacterized protein n=1 Tax=Deinococcus ruber TaxID=1848197 RepID=A0A918CII8_9DEIO|nr:hypothetical protein [Deinococcus ruber]GGR22769.1 hypothetical protein GCM10008957_38520 [Deinococcus ruber]
MLYRSTIKMLSDLISPKALERILADAARERHTTLTALDLPTLQTILKQDVYKRLQLNVPAGLAKRRVQNVLDTLAQEAGSAAAEDLSHSTQIITIDQRARQYALYFDWPETQRLRSVLSVARQATAEGRDAEALLHEGVELLEALERRLSEALVTQGQDLSELKAGLLRVSGVGGPKVRRLEALIKQIEEAQDARTLLPAEVERAMSLNLTLRKQVESSVMQNLRPAPENDDLSSEVLFDVSALPQDAQERVKSLDREHEARLLTELGREYAVLLRQESGLDQRLQALRAASEAGEVLGEQAIAQLREQLSSATRQRTEQQQHQLEVLEQRLGALDVPDASTLDAASSESVGTARQSLLVLQGMLKAGLLEQSEINELNDLVQTLEQGGAAERLLEWQRETYELERRAREVPGALADLSPLLSEARWALSNGQSVDLDPLWKLLERRMGEAAQQREDMDTRADRIMHDYDEYRSLAGETIQKLGRLADVLRAQRRLGALSSDARERYLQTLESAEALRDEAAAEFRAAREVTSAFGADALQGLLGVFDSEEGGLFGSSLFDSADLVADVPAPPLSVPPPLPQVALPARAWLVRQGQVVEGDLSPAEGWPTSPACEADVLRVAWLLDQAGTFGPRRLTLDLGDRIWTAQPRAEDTVVACGPDLQAAERLMVPWLSGAN